MSHKTTINHYITMYLDIGRDKWNAFSRSYEEYLEHFKPFINLFHKQNNKDNILYVFIDKSKYNEFNYLITNKNNIKVIEIDEEWLNNNSKIWGKLPREIEIMNSQTYKDLIGNRIRFPEHNNPKYTLINHSKIDLLNYIRINYGEKYDFYTWVDFGYFKKNEYIPDCLVDISLLKKDRVNYTLINPLDVNDNNIVYTLKNAPEKIAGYFFSGRGDIIDIYNSLYYLTLTEFQLHGYADDDQHLVLRCYNNCPELFEFHMLGAWHIALVKFQKINTHFIVKKPLSYKMINILNFVDPKNSYQWKQLFPYSVVYNFVDNDSNDHMLGINNIKYMENIEYMENIFCKYLDLIYFDLIILKDSDFHRKILDLFIVNKLKQNFTIICTN